MSQPMNREQRRMLKKQGQEVNEAGEVVADAKSAPKRARTNAKTDSGGSGSGGRVTSKSGGDGDDKPDRSRRRPEASTEERTKPLQFVREVRTEIRKVSWPSRPEVINYSLVVFFTVVALTAFIGVLDWLFSISILELFKP